jgi:hypothetical protein
MGTVTTEEALRRVFVRLTEIRDVLKEIRDQALPIEDEPQQADPRLRAVPEPKDPA